MRNRWYKKFPGGGYKLYIYNSIGRSPIKVYSSKTSNISITALPQVITGNDGKAEFWVDSKDYDLDLLVDIDVYDPKGDPFASFKKVSIFDLKSYFANIFANIYVKEEFTGGASNALDGIDGADLKTGAFALVSKDGICYPYWYVEGATDEENPPYVIAPDINPSGRWFLNLINNSDMVDGFHASQIPQANTIPVANSDGSLKDWITDNELLSKIKNVDGEGSGLDADLLRGLPADFTCNKSQSGYTKLPNGLIIQWGYTTENTVTFPIAFPNETFTVVIQLRGVNNPDRESSVYNVTTNGFNISSGVSVFYWIAIGY